MRIWDVDPGYLNRQSLLGEHRELHGMVSILVQGKKGYANHPETRRWAPYGWALKKRHDQLVAEMALRLYSHHTPVRVRRNEGAWPPTYINSPWEQFELLRQKYRDKEPGRIPLPDNAQQLWAHHKYSILARDVNLYRALGPEVSTIRSRQAYRELVTLLVEKMRFPPGAGGIRNALEHMWGHVSDPPGRQFARWSLGRLFKETQKRVREANEPYLQHSTALAELSIWIT